MSNHPEQAIAAHSKLHELIRNRWSPRAFADKDVAAEDLASILDAGRWAASSYNEQPWRFIVATRQQPEAFEKLLGLLLPFNQAWAKAAPVLILIVAKKSFSHNQQPNRHALHDAGAALANMFLQATALGLHGHGMAGFDSERAKTELEIPEDYEPAAFVALGYAGSPDSLPEGLREREMAPRQRKPLSELTFGSRWGVPFNF